MTFQSNIARFPATPHPKKSAMNLTLPRKRSKIGAQETNANMLKIMCRGLDTSCMKIEVMNRHGCVNATDGSKIPASMNFAPPIFSPTQTSIQIMTIAALAGLLLIQ
jgi:hypothetical protein